MKILSYLPVESPDYTISDDDIPCIVVNKNNIYIPSLLTSHACNSDDEICYVVMSNIGPNVDEDNHYDLNSINDAYIKAPKGSKLTFQQ